MIAVDTQKMTVQIADWVAKAKGKSRIFATEFVQDLAQAVIENTPVKTGFLRGSWYASINGVPHGAGQPDPSGAGAVARVNLVAADLQIGDSYYMANGAAYARRLEYGFVGVDSLGRHYNQGPRAFVRTALDNAQLIADETARRVAAEA